ncbi:hypothetical protein B9Z55_006808 [Caenorhabditis nigoni]|uniref:BTB domain-containing protein n=1 Tax=Caenorhabditis nigoni TaxID=1611254 RepID=A0A2G5V6L2_9PELO|nr:hypothetical protein B9Z55_006808 [Caenorhabditis nigoni]
MTTKVISYKAEQTAVSDRMNELETTEKDGIKHTWSGQVDSSQKASFNWNFDWEALKTQGVYRLVGHLIVRSVYDCWNPHRIDIDWTDTKHSVFATVESRGFSIYTTTFEYNLTAHSVGFPPPKIISYDEMFAATDKTDAILIVEGKKMNVNKTFLSIHSDYFSTLFSSNFKEKQMEEIEIKEVSYDDVGLLLSTIYPMQVFPNDETAEKLLELADRFLMPSAKHIVEHHLLNQSKLDNEKMMMLGDRYGIQFVLERSISQTDTVEKMKKLEKSPEYAKLSLETVERLFKRILQLV